MKSVEDDECGEIKIPESVIAALSDDLNTPLAISEIINIEKNMSPSEIKGQLKAVGNLFGILQHNPRKWLGYGQADGLLVDAENIETLLVERQAAKKNKNFKRADEIRDELSAQGIMIEDTPQGPKWRKAK
jgi:cysteinyl-tRNA synthetase